MIWFSEDVESDEIFIKVHRLLQKEIKEILMQYPNFSERDNRMKQKILATMSDCMKEEKQNDYKSFLRNMKNLMNNAVLCVDFDIHADYDIMTDVTKYFIMNGLGSYYYEINDTKKALEFYLQAYYMMKRKYKKSKEQFLIEHSYLKIGQAYERHGDLKSAQEFYSKSYSAKAKKKDDPHGVACALNQLGWATKRQGNFEKALEYFQRAYAINRKLYGDDHIDMSSTMNNLGLAYKVINILIDLFKKSSRHS